MPIKDLRINATNALIMSNLQLGGSQQSGRTDNVVAAKLRKLRWALEHANQSNGIVILTGRIFNKTNSFSDLSFLLNQEVLSNSSLYFMPDYPAYRQKGELNHRSMLGVIRNIVADKVIVGGAIIENEGYSGIMYLSTGEDYTLTSVTENHAQEQHYVFDYQRKIKARFNDSIIRTHLSSYPKEVSISSEGIYLGSAFRDTPSSNSIPSALRIFIGRNPELVEIPHETHVFDDSIERQEHKRTQVKTQALLSISEEFDPRHKKISDEGGVIKAIDALYGKSKITKTAYDIIKVMIEKKPA